MADELIFKTIAQEAYEGATEHYRMEQRGLVNGDPDTLAGRELMSLWARSHHLIRNSGWAYRGKEKYRTVQGHVKVVWVTKKGKRHQVMQDLWDEFANAPSLDGYGNMASLQDTWNGCMYEAGESITRMIIRKRKGSAIPLALQQIESEYLDPLFTNKNDGKTKAGITFKDGRPFKYNFFKKFPKGTHIFGLDGDRVAVDAEDIIHQFIRERPGQWRGVPKLAPIILPLYELDDLTDATVNKQKTSQAITWIIKNTNPVAAAAVGTAREVTDPNDVDPLGRKRVVVQSGSGGVQYLNKNEDLLSVQGADIGNAFEALVKLELRRIACGSGFSYEEYTGDLSNLSFSALKYVINEMKARAEFLYNTYTIPLGLAPLCARFKELAEIYSKKPVSTAYPSYRFPKRYTVDDLKDIQADLLEISANLGTYGHKLDERGLTFEDVAEDKALREAANITLPQPNLGQTNNTQPNSNSSSV